MIPGMLLRLLRRARALAALIVRLGLGAGCALALAGDTYHAVSMPERVRAYTRGIEFDFVDWTWEAAVVKVRQASVAPQRFLTEAERSRMVRSFFELRTRLNQLEADIVTAYADPAVADPAAATAAWRAEQAELRARLAEQQPLVEAIFQEQLAVILAGQGLTLGGQPLPPVAFHFTPLPLALVVSPRDRIEQAAIQMIEGGLTMDQIEALEARAAAGLDVSTLVTPVGGIGTYPTMVAESANLYWIASVVAHEWVHNFLTLRPLGLLYDASPELRTMNETVAELAGNELGARLIERYYPELAAPPAAFGNFIDRARPPAAEPAIPAFDFRAEMRLTRVRTDELLAQGQIEAAEAYMEARRQFFWDNGYRLRKLNQAYFAFHGAYNAAPGGGASGADPIGPAVRLLRRRSASLADFLNQISWYTSIGQLRARLGLPNP